MPCTAFLFELCNGLFVSFDLQSVDHVLALCLLVVRPDCQGRRSQASMSRPWPQCQGRVAKATGMPMPQWLGRNVKAKDVKPRLSKPECQRTVCQGQKTTVGMGRYARKPCALGAGALPPRSGLQAPWPLAGRANTLMDTRFSIDLWQYVADGRAGVGRHAIGVPTAICHP